MNVGYTVTFAHILFLVKGNVEILEIPEHFTECFEPSIPDTYACIKTLSENNHSISKNKSEELRIKDEFFWHPQKRTRRECRAIPEHERISLFRAINELKHDKSLRPNVYDNFANYHSNGVIKSVHFGPNFLGWHRIYILRFEELLRKKNPNLALCYWDNRLDYISSKPRNSIMFTPKIMGTSRGPVRDGPFAGWKTIIGKSLSRHVGKNGGLMSPYRINQILSRKRHRHIVSGTAKNAFNFEKIHNQVHIFIGGQMNDLYTSSRDPFFWIHHSFADFIWEIFRSNLHSHGINPQDDYVNTKNKLHHRSRFMDRLVPFRNIDGYSDYFTKHIYEYEEAPKCPDCGNSPYLKCNKKKNKCYSIKANENLRQVQAKNSTNNRLSKPLRNATVLYVNFQMETVVFVPIKIIFPKALIQSVKCDLVKDGDDLCNETVVYVQSHSLMENFSYKSYIMADVSIPLWLYTFVAVKKPSSNHSDAFVSVKRKTGTSCEAVTPSVDKRRYVSTSGFIRVSENEPKSYIESLDELDQNQYTFDPLTPDTIENGVKLVFKCF